LSSVIFNNEVELSPTLVPIMKESVAVLRPSGLFPEFGDDKCFEERSGSRTVTGDVFFGHAEKRGLDPRVEKVPSGSFQNPFGLNGMPGLDPVDEKQLLQNGDIFSGRRVKTIFSPLSTLQRSLKYKGLCRERPSAPAGPDFPVRV